MRKICHLLGACMLSILPLKAQEAYHEEVPLTINDATLIGIGSFHAKDTYLSDSQYKGIGFRLTNERMKYLSHSPHMSRQQVIDIQYANLKNPTQTTSTLMALVDYSLSYHYHFHIHPTFKLLTGGGIHTMAGVIYNTRNGNNPASAKFDIDLNLSLMAIHTPYIKNYPLTLRYQIDMPFFGALFSPHYGQSYYEIFSLGNTKNIVQVSAPHNKIAVRNSFTVDFPIGSFILRAGYLGDFYKSNVNGIQNKIKSHAFMLGIVRELRSFSRKKNKSNTYNSALYD